MDMGNNPEPSSQASVFSRLFPNLPQTGHLAKAEDLHIQVAIMSPGYVLLSETAPVLARK